MQHDRERRRKQERGADGLQRARRDQRPSRRCKAAERGGGAEEAEAEQEDALAADAIGDPSGRHEQRPEHDGVRVEDPGELGGGDVRDVARIAGKATKSTVPSSETTNTATLVSASVRQAEEEGVISGPA